MRVMTHYTFRLGIMSLWVDSGDLSADVVFVGEIGVAADAQSTTTVNAQAQWVIGVIIVRSVTVLTADDGVGRILDVVVFVLVVFRAGLGCFILDRVILPKGLIGLAVPSVHVTALLDPK